jgi:hypothetical protein
VELVLANKVPVKDAAFRELCMKYGTEELYHKLVKLTGGA